jgi:hypothetical protein
VRDRSEIKIMAYQAGDTIEASTYNTFVNSSSSPFGYNHFAGTGSGSYGLGQTHIPTVSANAGNITASQWNTLFTSMDNIASHTNDTLTSRTQVSAGDTIAIKAAVEADLATLAASVAGGCVNITAISESAELQSSVSSTRWNGSHTVEQSITFASNNDLRHFFNAGGKMRMKLTRNGNGGSSATSKDSSVDEMITGMGNFDLGAQVSTRSGSTETLTTNGLTNGVADLGTGYTTLMLLTQDSGTYTSMKLQVDAKTDTGDYDTATVVTMKLTLTDVDGTDGQYTSGNTAGVDQYAEFIGTTDVALHTMNPTTAEGLASVASISSSAVVSNTTA